MSTENTFIQVHLIYCLFISLFLPYILLILRPHSAILSYRPFRALQKTGDHGSKKVFGSLDLIAIPQVLFRISAIFDHSPFVLLSWYRKTRRPEVCKKDTIVKGQLGFQHLHHPNRQTSRVMVLWQTNWKVHTSKIKEDSSKKSGSKSFSKISHSKFDKVPKIGLRNFFNISWT